MTTGEVARALGVTNATINRWVTGKIITPAMTTAGGHHRWVMEDVREQLLTRGDMLDRRSLQHDQDQDDEQLQRGPTISRRHVESPSRIEPLAVAAAIITSNRGVLIGRRNDREPLWTFIAGQIHPGESPEDAIVRETKEEAGLVVAAGHVIGRRVHPATGRTMIYVAAVPTHGTDAYVGDELELAELRWATLAQADELMPDMYEPVHRHLEHTIP